MGLKEANEKANVQMMARFDSLPKTPRFPEKIPAIHRQRITQDYQGLDAPNHLYQSQPVAFDACWTGVVVQVNTKYEGTHGTAKDPSQYTIDCMLNVDNPPEADSKPRKGDSKPRKGDSKPRKGDSKPRKGDSKPRNGDSQPPERDSQPPHFGWTLDLNGKRVDKGHVFLDRGDLAAGRPKPGNSDKKLEFELEYPGGEVELQGLEEDGQIKRTCEVKRYKY